MRSFLGWIMAGFGVLILVGTGTCSGAYLWMLVTEQIIGGYGLPGLNDLGFIAIFTAIPAAIGWVSYRLGRWLMGPAPKKPPADP